MQIRQTVAGKPCCKKSGLAGLGFWESVAGALASGLTSGSGGPAGAPQPDITVSPPITVSPQISPVFQQQFQPSDSAMSAGTSQTLPSTVPGMMPAGAALPVGYQPVAPQIPMPATAQTDPLKKYLPWMVAGVGAIILWKLVKQRNAVAKRREKVETP